MGLTPVEGGIIQEGMGLLGGVVNSIANSIESKKQRLWNEKMWNMNNAYNAPVQQMQRLKEAGLNPNLIYGTGTASAGNSSSPAEGYTRAEHDFSGLGSANYVGMMLQQKDVESMVNLREKQGNLAAEDTRLRSLEVITELIKQIGMQTDNETKTFDLGMKKELKDTTISTAIAVLNNLTSTGANIDADTSNKIAQNENIKAEKGLILANTNKAHWDAKQTRQYIKNLQTQKAYQDLEYQWKYIDVHEKAIRMNEILPEEIQQSRTTSDMKDLEYWLTSIGANEKGLFSVLTNYMIRTYEQNRPGIIDPPFRQPYKRNRKH